MLVTGTGFTGTTAVTLDAAPLAFNLEGDTTLRVNLPPGAAAPERIKITTPMGESLAAGASAARPETTPVRDASLWTMGPEKTLETMADGTPLGVYQPMACTPGQVFEGSCLVKTEGLTKGLAQINMVFTRSGGAPTYGADLQDGIPKGTPANGSVALAVRGIAPAGATEVKFYIQLDKANQGAKAAFTEVAFFRLLAPSTGAQPQAPSPSVEPRRNEWTKPQPHTLTAPANGTAGLYSTLACAPGQVVEGTAFVRTEGMANKGHAQINMQFQDDNGVAKGYGARMAYSTPMQSASEARRFVGVRGTAPPGTAKVMVYLQVEKCDPGAKATFDHVTFVKRLPAAPGPETQASSSVQGLAIRDFKAAAPLVSAGQAGELLWQKVEGGPTQLRLKNLTSGGPDHELAVGSTSQAILPFRWRQTFQLTAKRQAPYAETRAETSVAVQGIDRLAGDTEHVPAAYLNGALDHEAAWRHVTGLGWHDGELFFSEGADHTIRKVGKGDASVVAFAGRRGCPQSPAENAPVRLNLPGPMAYLEPYFYVVDTGSHTIKRILAVGKGSLETFAGANGKPGLQDGDLETARFSSPADIVADPSKKILYVADRGNDRIRRIIQKSGSQEGAVFQVETLPVPFTDPQGLALVPGVGKAPSTLFVASTAEALIQKVTIKPEMHVGSLAGWKPEAVAGAAGASGFLNAVGTQARFNRPQGLAHLSESNRLLVADAGNNLIRQINLLTGMVDTFAGNPDCQPGHLDGHGQSARFEAPSRLALGDHGELYVADAAGRALRRISADGAVATLGSNSPEPSSGSHDGPSSEARFYQPLGVVMDRSGTTYVADRANHAIRRISPTGDVDTFAGHLGTSGQAMGQPLEARFQAPTELALDAKHHLFVLDEGDPRRLLQVDDRSVIKLAYQPTHIAACPMARESALAMAVQDADGTCHVDLLRNQNTERVAAGLRPVALAVNAMDQVFVLTQAPEAQQVILHKYVCHKGEAEPWKEVGTFALGPDGEGGTNAGVPMIHGMAADSKGAVLLADTANGLIWKVLFEEKIAEVVAGRYPFLGPTRGAKLLKEPLYQPHRIAVTPMDDLVVTTGHGLVQITAPGNPSNPWEAPRLAKNGGHWADSEASASSRDLRAPKERMANSRPGSFKEALQKRTVGVDRMEAIRKAEAALAEAARAKEASAKHANASATGKAFRNAWDQFMPFQVERQKVMDAHRPAQTSPDRDEDDEWRDEPTSSSTPATVAPPQPVPVIVLTPAQEAAAKAKSERDEKRRELDRKHREKIQADENRAKEHAAEAKAQRLKAFADEKAKAEAKAAKGE